MRAFEYRDGWPSVKMCGQEERWVANLKDGWISTAEVKVSKEIDG
jgi:hypothetical protein